ncbi:MAG TPA: hypothetical protein VK530_15365 [Candidatus Acidoferrum sp.]|nr:hypothetical protein [Candidatus Acidoferrum sp.]
MKLLPLVLLCAALTFLFAGCATTQSENVSERPWNAQKGWEHGLPSSINEGR